MERRRDEQRDGRRARLRNRWRREAGRARLEPGATTSVAARRARTARTASRCGMKSRSRRRPRLPVVATTSISPRASRADDLRFGNTCGRRDIARRVHVGESVGIHDLVWRAIQGKKPADSQPPRRDWPVRANFSGFSARRHLHRTLFGGSSCTECEVRTSGVGGGSGFSA